MNQPISLEKTCQNTTFGQDLPSKKYLDGSRIYHPKVKIVSFLQSFKFVNWWIRGFVFFDVTNRLIYFFTYRNVAQIYFWPKLSTQKFTCFYGYLIELGHFIASSHMPFAIQGSAVHLKNWLPTCRPFCRSNWSTYLLQIAFSLIRRNNVSLL